MPRPSMQIAMVSNLFPPRVLGGYELLAADLARQFATWGHTVTVFTTRGKGLPPEEKTAEGVRVVRNLRLVREFEHGTSPGRDRVRHLWTGRKNAAAMAMALGSGPRFDAALVMSLRRLGTAPWRALDENGIGSVVTVNDDWPAALSQERYPSWRARLERPTMGVQSNRSLIGLRPRAVVYLSHALRDDLHRVGCQLPWGTVLSQGVDTHLFKPDTEPSVCTKRRGPRLLFVGRLHPSKGPDVAIDAVAALHSMGCFAELTLAGAPVTPAYGAELQAQARRRSVTSAIHFVGARPRQSLPQLMRAHDQFLFISKLDSEGQGLTYLEAMACGLPVVASPSGGAKEFLRNYCQYEEAAAPTGDALAASVMRLWRDPSRMSALAKVGPQIVSEYASLSQYARELERQLHSATERPSRSEAA